MHEKAVPNSEGKCAKGGKVVQDKLLCDTSKLLLLDRENNQGLEVLCENSIHNLWSEVARES